MTSRYRLFISKLTPKRVLLAIMLIYGLYFLIPVFPIYGYNTQACNNDCIVIKIPITDIHIFPDIIAFRFFVFKITTILSWLWLHGMVFMLLILERKKIFYQESSATPQGYKMIQDKD